MASAVKLLRSEGCLCVRLDQQVRQITEIWLREYNEEHSRHAVCLQTRGIVGPWTINISYFALGGGIPIGGALVGVFAGLRFSDPKRPLSLIGTVILAVLCWVFASLLLVARTCGCPLPSISTTVPKDACNKPNCCGSLNPVN